MVPQKTYVQTNKRAKRQTKEKTSREYYIEHLFYRLGTKILTCENKFDRQKKIQSTQKSLKSTQQN